jgi:hypothetical protein
MPKVINRRQYKQVTFLTLQEDLSQILDEIQESGDSIEVEHHGQRFRILPVTSEALVNSGNKLDNLIERPYLSCDPEDIVHLDWSQEWRTHDLS